MFANCFVSDCFVVFRTRGTMQCAMWKHEQTETAVSAFGFQQKKQIFFLFFIKTEIEIAVSG